MSADRTIQTVNGFYVSRERDDLGFYAGEWSE